MAYGPEAIATQGLKHQLAVFNLHTAPTIKQTEIQTNYVASSYSEQAYDRQNAHTQLYYPSTFNYFNTQSDYRLCSNITHIVIKIIRTSCSTTLS